MDEEITPPIENGYVMTHDVRQGMMDFVPLAPAQPAEGTGHNIAAEYLRKLESDVLTLLWLKKNPSNP